jgi:hypothetical protein
MSFAANRRKSSAQTSRLIAPLALVLLGVFALCTIFGYTLARESDARHQDQRRASLLGVVDEFRNVFANMTASPIRPILRARSRRSGWCAIATSAPA